MKLSLAYKTIRFDLFCLGLLATMKGVIGLPKEVLYPLVDQRAAKLQAGNQYPAALRPTFTSAFMLRIKDIDTIF